MYRNLIKQYYLLVWGLLRPSNHISRLLSAHISVFGENLIIRHISIFDGAYHACLMRAASPKSATTVRRTPLGSFWIRQFCGSRREGVGERAGGRERGKGERGERGKGGKGVREEGEGGRRRRKEREG